MLLKIDIFLDCLRQVYFDRDKGQLSGSDDLFALPVSHRMFGDKEIDDLYKINSNESINHKIRS